MTTTVVVQIEGMIDGLELTNTLGRPVESTSTFANGDEHVTIHLDARELTRLLVPYLLHDATAQLRSTANMRAI